MPVCERNAAAAGPAGPGSWLLTDTSEQTVTLETGQRPAGVGVTPAVLTSPPGRRLQRVRRQAAGGQHTDIASQSRCVLARPTRRFVLKEGAAPRPQSPVRWLEGDDACEALLAPP